MTTLHHHGQNFQILLKNYQAYFHKVKNISEESLDSMPSPSPSVKIQKIGGKGVKAKHCWALSTNFKNKKIVDITQQCFALLPQVNLPVNNLNFH